MPGTVAGVRNMVMIKTEESLYLLGNLHFHERKQMAIRLGE